MTIDTDIIEELLPGSLLDHFLIAMPGLQDPNFSHALVYVCEHSEEGAMGLVVNKSMDIQLGKIYNQLDIKQATAQRDQAVFFGGPVGIEQGFILHSTGRQRWESTLKISSQISLTTSKDILQDIASGEGPEASMVLLGYSGWGGGQLEKEIADNSWLTVPAAANIIFQTPTDKRVASAAAHIGVDLSLLSHGIGHA